jgi:hypothetical protein
MGLLLFGALGFLFMRRIMPNLAFRVIVMAESRTLLGMLLKIAVALLLVVSLVTGLVWQVHVADVLLFVFCLIFLLVVSRSYPPTEDDSPGSTPFVGSLASRAPPIL